MSFIKQAEANVIGQARFYTEAVEFFTEMAPTLGSRAATTAGRELMCEGLSKLVQGLQLEQQAALSRCFILSGVGGTEAAAFSREQAKRLFGGRYSTIEWLHQGHQTPLSWRESDEHAFEAELAGRLKENEHE